MKFSQTDVEEEVVLDLDELLKEPKEIVLYNDDHNTFDFVIESLVKVCSHTLTQAEQCTYLVHYKGKCSVKRGEVEKLQSMRTALLDRGLSAEIE
ncbi:MAG: ATP-dependent Clp protease adaptor ClpS [Cryomorphaceae bacterium]|nr:ATP-dependent Clp protease adaptor ClpS [Flavobacteriales bacterium]